MEHRLHNADVVSHYVIVIEECIIILSERNQVLFEDVKRSLLVLMRIEHAQGLSFLIIEFIYALGTCDSEYLSAGDTPILYQK